MTLPDAWSEQRDELRRIAAHLLARARYQASGRFSLEPAPGGFATPTFATGDVSYRRLRVTAADRTLLVDEHIDSTGAVSHYFPVDDISLASLADGIGVELDPDFSVGDDSPALGDLHRPIRIDPLAVGTVGEWYALGARSRSTGRLPDSTPARPASPGCGLSISTSAPTSRWRPADDAISAPRRATSGTRSRTSTSARGATNDPATTRYWNAPFGAARGHADIVESDAPSAAATAFFDEGIRRLRG